MYVGRSVNERPIFDCPPQTGIVSKVDVLPNNASLLSSSSSSMLLPSEEEQYMDCSTFPRMCLLSYVLGAYLASSSSPGPSGFAKMEQPGSEVDNLPLCIQDKAVTD